MDVVLWIIVAICVSVLLWLLASVAAKLPHGHSPIPPARKKEHLPYQDKRGYAPTKPLGNPPRPQDGHTDTTAR